MSFRNRNASIIGPGRADTVPTSFSDLGRRWVIGDGISFTAAHVAYEWNRSRSNPAIIDGSIDILFDEFDYGETSNSLYLQAVNSAIAAETPADPAPPNVAIEGTAVLIAADRVLVDRGGDVDSRDAGLAVFLEPDDLENIGTIFSYTNPVITRFGGPTGDAVGTFNSVNTLAAGVVEFAAQSALGDSGGAYVLDLPSEQKGFVTAIQSANRGFIDPQTGLPVISGNALASYFTADAFNEINEFLEGRNQSGNVTDDEPTNLIVGREIADGLIVNEQILAIQGSFRADIVLGRGGNDVLTDGDDAGDTVWADDQLFGGEGNDYLIVGAGNDLIHGGDFRDYGSGRVELAEDGIDTADFGGNESGIQIRLPILESRADSLYAAILDTDVDNAIFVTSVGDEATGEPAYTNTLVSIEKIKGTEAADTLFIDSLGEDFLATLANAATGVGGVAEIDLLGDPGNGRATGADGINFSAIVDDGVTVDLRDLTNQTIAGQTAGAIPLKLLNIENVVGTQQADTIYAIDPTIVNGSNGLPDIPLGSVISGGGGNDVLYGGGGYDYLAGGDDNDIIHLGFGDVAHGGAGQDVFHLTTSTSLFNNVTILDFNPSEDTILIDGNPMAGFSKTTTTVDFGFIPENEEEDRIDYKIQQTAASLTNGSGGFASGGGLQPLVALDNGEIDRESGEVDAYQDGRYRDIVVSSANGALNSGRVTYIDANLTFPSTSVGLASRRVQSLATGVSSGGLGLSSVSVNSYLSIFFGDSGGFQNSLFSHTMDGVDPNESPNSGIVRSGEFRFGRILVEDINPFLDGVARTGFEADGLTTSSLAIAGDPNNPNPVLVFQTGPVQVSAPSTGSNQLAARFSRPGNVSSRPSFQLSNGSGVNIISNISSLFVSAGGGRFANTAIELSAAKAFDAALSIRNSGLVGDGNDFNLTTVGLSSSVAGNFRTAPSVGGDLIGTDGGDFLLGSDLNDNLYALEIGAVGAADVTDLLVGGLGDDIYNVNSVAGRVLVADGFDGTASGGGQDRLIVSFAADTLQVSTTSDNKDLILSTDEVGNNAEVVLIGQIIGNSANQIETVEFSDGVTLSQSDLLDQVGLLPVAIADFASLEDESIDFAIPDGGFFDPLSRDISVSASLADGSALPAWLEYSNGMLTGTPPTNFNGQLEIELSGTAGADTASATFGVTIESVNDAPIVNAAIPDQDYTAGELVDFVIAESSFVDVDGDEIFLTASLSDGSFLPDWLDFDGSRFVGTAPVEFTGLLDISIAADDGSLSASNSFILTIDAPDVDAAIPYPVIANIVEYNSYYMEGGAVNDEMFALSSSNNTNMVALGGNDLLISESWNSSLQGREGTDILVMRAGGIRAYGDAEGDQYGNVTGPGSTQSVDYFVFDIADYVGASYELDPLYVWADIKDYADGVDKIAILNGTGGANSFADLTITQNGTSVDISTPTIPRIVLENTAVADIDASDFIFGDGSTASAQSASVPQNILVDDYRRYTGNSRLQAPVEGRFREPGILYSDVPELNALRAGLNRESFSLSSRVLTRDAAVDIFDYYDQLNKNPYKQPSSFAQSQMAATPDVVSKEVVSASSSAANNADALKIALMTQDMNMFGVTPAVTSMKMQDRSGMVMDYFAA